MIPSFINIHAILLHYLTLFYIINITWSLCRSPESRRLSLLVFPIVTFKQDRVTLRESHSKQIWKKRILNIPNPPTPTYTDITSCFSPSVNKKAGTSAFLNDENTENQSSSKFSSKARQRPRQIQRREKARSKGREFQRTYCRWFKIALASNTEIIYNQL